VIDFSSGHFNNIDSGTPQAILFACGFGCDGRQQVGDPAVVHPFVEVTVPEPGSLALVLAALVGVWFARRYRRTTPAFILADRTPDFQGAASRIITGAERTLPICR
jgi:hypothetical protein